MNLLISLVLTACGSADPQALTCPEGQSLQGENCVTPLETAPGVPEARAQASTGAVASDGQAYSDAWLVILSSSTTPGAEPPALQAMVEDSDAFPGAEPVRLDSSRFKGLMPCYEVVAALASQDKGAAMALSAALKQRGFDNYVKNAGRWVGARPALEASCVRLREGRTGKCPGGARFVEVWNETVYLEVGADPETVESAFINAPAERPIVADGSVWEAPLALKTIGDLTLGQPIFVSSFGQTGSSRCSVEGFVSLTRGLPHFGWMSRWPDEVPYQPGCGTSELFARLDCPSWVQERVLAWSAPGVGLAWNAPGEVAVPVDEAETPQGEHRRALESSEAWRLARARAEEEAEDRGVALVEEITSQTWRLGTKEYHLVTGRLYSGEGIADCGGDDVNLLVQGLIPSGGGDAAVSFRDTSFEEWTGFVEVDSGLAVVARSFPVSTHLLSSEGEEFCSDSVPFCDCGC